MNFELTSEQRLLKKSVKDFMEKECPRDIVRDIDERGDFPHDIFAKMAELGWAGIHIPEQYGGQGMTFIDYIIFMEELAYFFPMMIGPFIDTELVCCYVQNYGSKEQQQVYLPPVARGAVHYCFALTEPDAGSDAGALALSARESGNEYILNGTKVFITGAHLSDKLLVFGRTRSDVEKHKGISTFMVKTNCLGVELRKIPCLGMRPYYPNEISFDNVKVPKADLVGELNEGWSNLQPVINMGRIMIGIAAVGVAQAAIDIASNYTKSRKQFGRTISSFQAIQHKLATMQIRCSAARALAYQASWLYNNRQRCFKEGSMVKYFATENLITTVNECLQLLGGYGYAMEYDMQLFLRDTRFLTLGGGTSEIQLNLVAHEMGLR